MEVYFCPKKQNSFSLLFVHCTQNYLYCSHFTSKHNICLISVSTSSPHIISFFFCFLFFHVYCPVLLIITIQYIKGIIKYHGIHIQLFTKGHKSHKNQGIPKETNPHPTHMRSHSPLPPPHPSSPSHPTQTQTHTNIQWTDNMVVTLPFTHTHTHTHTNRNKNKCKLVIWYKIFKKNKIKK